MTARLLPSKPKPGSAGFTLFEALVSVALMSLIVASLSAVTGQWVPNWHRGFGNVQRFEFLTSVYGVWSRISLRLSSLRPTAPRRRRFSSATRFR